MPSLTTGDAWVGRVDLAARRLVFLFSGQAHRQHNNNKLGVGIQKAFRTSCLFLLLLLVSSGRQHNKTAQFK